MSEPFDIEKGQPNKDQSSETNNNIILLSSFTKSSEPLANLGSKMLSSVLTQSLDESSETVSLHESEFVTFIRRKRPLRINHTPSRYTNLAGNFEFAE